MPIDKVAKFTLFKSMSQSDIARLPPIPTI
jgi:hypothetical protein